MGDEQHRLWTLGPYPQQFEAHFIAAQRIERGERLVHQEDIGIEQKRARYRDALLHATRQFVDPLVLEIRKTDQGQQLAGALQLIFADVTIFVPHRKRDVAQHVEPGKQGRSLEHDTYLVTWFGDDPIVDSHLPLCRLQQAGDQPQQGGFAAAGGS